MNKHDRCVEWMRDGIEFSTDIGNDDGVEDAKYILELLERDNAKKPTKGMEYGIEWDECPVCQCGISEWDEDEKDGNLFCPHCGQAIDWSEE